MVVAAELPAAGTAPVPPPAAAPVAHAVPDIGPLTAAKGIALCGHFLAEELLLLPDLDWEALPEVDRCVHCAESWSRGTG